PAALAAASAGAHAQAAGALSASKLGALSALALGAAVLRVEEHDGNDHPGPQNEVPGDGVGQGDDDRQGERVEIQESHGERADSYEYVLELWLHHFPRDLPWHGHRSTGPVCRR